MKLAVIYGTRPEAVKLSPLIPLLDHPTLVRTGQHTDLADGLLSPTISLHLPSDNDPLRYAHLIGVALERVLKRERPDAVVVQGDTASAYAGALAAEFLNIPVAHVEAGLRTGNLDDPWPEESFRVAIDRVAKWCFCPTEDNARNLDLEPQEVARETYVTGNTGIDALYAHTQPIHAPYVTHPRVMVTLHRRESFGQPLLHIVHGLFHTALRYPGVEFVWPQHPNPEIHKALPPEIPRNVHLSDALPPLNFARMLASSRAVLTDSGGVQEEAAALGVPCIVARDVTDRPESVQEGLAIVAGRTSEGIQASLTKALTYQLRAVPSECFGDGKAAQRIAQVLTGKHVTVGA